MVFCWNLLYSFSWHYLSQRVISFIQLCGSNEKCLCIKRKPRIQLWKDNRYVRNPSSLQKDKFPYEREKIMDQDIHKIIFNSKLNYFHQFYFPSHRINFKENCKGDFLDFHRPSLSSRWNRIIIPTVFWCSVLYRIPLLQ